MHQLLETLVALKQDSNQYCREVHMPAPGTADRPPAEPAQSEPENLYNRKEAAAYLLVDPRTVTRYRVDGKLRFVSKDNDKIRYREEDLNDCYFWKWGKRP